MNKLYPDAASALDGILRNDMLIAAGGFGLCGIPERLLDAIRDSGVTGLTFASNNAGIDNEGIGKLLRTRQVKKMISSYVGENKEFERQYLSGELEVEFCPQGTLAERMRAGGAGIPGFYTRTGVGTEVAKGKEHKEFPDRDGVMQTYILERGIFADLSIIKAWKADTTGNLVFRKTARNFNLPAATCGKICVAEVEEVVPAGSLDPDQIHLPGVFVNRIVCGAPYDKKIEFRTVRQRDGMIDRRIILVPLLALAGTSLPGCAAVAIPALAGGAMVGTRIDGQDAGQGQAGASAPVPAVAAPAQRPAPMPSPTPSVSVRPAADAPPSPAPTKAPVSAPAPMPVATPPVAAAAPAITPTVAAGASGMPRPVQNGFAEFVRYGRGVAAVSAGPNGALSAMLSHPTALDGQRKRCAPGDKPVAVIDLDPAGGLFTPPADPERDVPRSLGLAVLREAGVQIAWLSDLPVSEIGRIRSALEFAGLDIRGQDIVSLRRDPEDRKQTRRESLAATSCIIAIAGDEKSDFDERFRYLKNPESGVALETAIGDGWFLIDPIFPLAQQGQQLP